MLTKCCSATSMGITMADRLSGRATVHLILEEIITSNLTVTVAKGTKEYTSSILRVSYKTPLCVTMTPPFINKSL